MHGNHGPGQNTTARPLVLGAILLVILLLAGALLFAFKPRHVRIQDASSSGTPAKIGLDEISRNMVGGGPPKDGIPAIDNPVYVNASQAGLFNDDVVVGFVRNGRAYAYPRRILYWHEIVNDRIGDEDISVTYCPLTGSYMGFGGKNLGVSGKLYNSNLVMYDRATDSHIPQMLATAVDGPIKREKLEQFPLIVTTWARWRGAYPDSMVLSLETGYDRDYSRNPYPGYDDVLRVWFPVTAKSDRFRTKEVMVVAHIDGTPVAIQKRILRERDGMRFDIGDTTIEARYNPSLDHAALMTKRGEPILSFEAFWFAWYAYYPDTIVIE